MIKTLLLLLFLSPVNAGEITKSDCDDIYKILREENGYIKEQGAKDIYRRCLESIR